VHEVVDKRATYDFAKFGIKDQHIREFYQVLDQNQVTVIVAPTGAGKSTLIPYRLMVPLDDFPPDLFTRYGQIIVTQPRTQATRNIPAFVASDLHGSSLGAGFDVGFQHHGNPATDWRNKLVYMTDGTLINMIVRNELGRLGLIMIDEAHERSVNIDLILGLLKTQLPRFPRLKLIIASATINTELFINYFKSTTVGFYGFSGKREHPVETRFADQAIPRAQMPTMMPKAVATKVIGLLQAMVAGEEKVRGDILAFLQGEKPICRAVDLIRESVEDDPKLAGKVEVLPLYTKLRQHEQDLALKPKRDPSKRRVIVSTNVAETSLTVEGIVHVVDSGLINESRWDPKTQTTFVEPTTHSRAGCQQRWGRAGRKEPGIAHCLYTQEQFDDPSIFPPHTTSEITRAPLEQIVLTAKAAGVDNIQTFPWIERPSDIELARAPEALRQIGAMDPDGDLTDHGLELRSFAEEPDIANLMILADRFGCAVEMATLIPMRKLGGYRNLLQWDKSWDAPTKRAVHRIHAALLKPCIDDLEFSLKIWEAWEGTAFGCTTDKQREEWSRVSFVNHSIFSNKLASERASLLQALSGHKREIESRPINFDLLTRLRIVMTYGLPNQIYRLTGRDGPDAQSQSNYLPYLNESQAGAALARLHENAKVEITPESVCFGRDIEMFVCGKRQRINRRTSALRPPDTTLAVAFVTVIKTRWVEVVGKSLLDVARLIASETRDPNGLLIRTFANSRLLIDQNYPLGSMFHCRRASRGGAVAIEEFRKKAPPVLIRGSFDEVEVPEILEVEEAEGRLSETAGMREESKKRVSFDRTDDEIAPVWVDVEQNQEEESTAETRSVDRFADLEGTVLNLSPGLQECEAIVTDFDLGNPAWPRVIFQIPSAQSPFDAFRARYGVGDSVSVEVLQLERYVTDWFAYLVVREVETGLEIVMDPYDCSLLGRNFALEEPILHAGDRFNVTVEEIFPAVAVPTGRRDIKRQDDSRFGRVRVHRLKEAAESAAAFLARQTERTVDAEIVEITDKGVYLWLDPRPSAKGVPCGAFVFPDRLPQRPDEMSLGKRCRVRVARKSLSKKPLQRRLGEGTPELEATLSRRQWSADLQWDPSDKLLTVTKPLTYEDRCRLTKLSRNPEYRRTINLLFRRSNEFDVRVIDMTLLTALDTKKRQDASVTGRVISVLDDRAFVSIEGGADLPVPRHEITIGRERSLRDVIQEGADIELQIADVNLEEGSAKLTGLRRGSFQINSQLIGGLIGRGGNNINRIQTDTHTSIDIKESVVTVKAESDDALQHAYDEIENAVSFATAVVQVSPKLAYKVIGTQGAHKKLIIAATKAYITMQEGSDGRFNGLIDVRAASTTDIRKVLDLIKTLADSSASFLTEPRKSKRITPMAPKAAKLSAPPWPVKKKSSTPAPPATTLPTKTPTVRRSTVSQMEHVTDNRRWLLLRHKPIGFLSSIFGSPKSLPEKIAELTGTQITLKGDKPHVVSIRGTPEAIKQAVSRIEYL
jgi:HrpA-like RNA helicase